jgi:hypothetical protein
MLAAVFASVKTSGRLDVWRAMLAHAGGRQTGRQWSFFGRLAAVWAHAGMLALLPAVLAVWRMLAACWRPP